MVRKKTRLWKKLEFREETKQTKEERNTKMLSSKRKRMMKMLKMIQISNGKTRTKR